jgi:hypothetical protein
VLKEETTKIRRVLDLLKPPKHSAQGGNKKDTQSLDIPEPLDRSEG